MLTTMNMSQDNLLSVILYTLKLIDIIGQKKKRKKSKLHDLEKKIESFPRDFQSFSQRVDHDILLKLPHFFH